MYWHESFPRRRRSLAVPLWTVALGLTAAALFLRLTS